MQGWGNNTFVILLTFLQLDIELLNALVFPVLHCKKKINQVALPMISNEHFLDTYLVIRKNLLKFDFKLCIAKIFF